MKTGVILLGLENDEDASPDLFADPEEKKNAALTEAMDKINRINGSETVVLGSQQYTKQGGKGRADVFADAIKHDNKSPNPTTRWSDIIELK